MNSLHIIPTPSKKAGLLENVPIRTPRLRIREFQLADASHLYALHRDARATRYAGGTRTQEQSFQSLCRMMNRVRGTGYGAFALELCTTRELIGWAGIQSMPDSPRLELFYALKPAYWGLGLATEAGEALLNTIFALPHKPISEIFALVYPQNIGSIRVLEKLGMSFIDYHFDQATQRYACLYWTQREAFLSKTTSAVLNQSSSKK